MPKNYFWALILLGLLTELANCQWTAFDVKDGSFEEMIVEDLKKSSLKTMITIDEEHTQAVKDFVDYSFLLMNSLQASGTWEKDVEDRGVKENILSSQADDMLTTPYNKDGQGSSDRDLEFYITMNDREHKRKVATIAIHKGNNLTFVPSKAVLIAKQMNVTIYVREERAGDKFRHCLVDMDIHFKDYKSNGVELPKKLTKEELIDAPYYSLYMNSTECQIAFYTNLMEFSPSDSEKTRYGLFLFVCCLIQGVSTGWLLYRMMDEEQAGGTLKGLSSFTFMLIAAWDAVIAFFCWGSLGIHFILAVFAFMFIFGMLIFGELMLAGAAFDVRSNVCYVAAGVVTSLILALTFFATISYDLSDWYLLPASFYLVPQIAESLRRGYDFNISQVFGMLPFRVLFVIYFRMNLFNYPRKAIHYNFAKTCLIIIAVQVIILVLISKQLRRVIRCLYTGKYINEAEHLEFQDSEGQVERKDDICSICLGVLDGTNDLEAKEPEVGATDEQPKPPSVLKVKVTPCGHAFHENCLKDWIKKQRACPNCRKKFSEKDFVAQEV